MRYIKIQVSHPKTAKEPFSSAGQKKFFKVKYFSGAFSDGAKIKRNAFVRNHINRCTLQSLCAFPLGQEAICHVAFVFVDFTLKNFSGQLHFADFDRN
jgi:hypothetical protein